MLNLWRTLITVRGGVLVRLATRVEKSADWIIAMSQPVISFTQYSCVSSGCGWEGGNDSFVCGGRAGWAGRQAGRRACRVKSGIG